MLKETLVCTSCDKEKALEEFSFRNKKKGIRVMRCKVCIREYNRQHYQANKQYYKKKARRWDAENKPDRIETIQRYIIQYLLEHPCIDCGETDPIVLDFDHVRDKKLYNVSAMVRHFLNIEPIKKEIAKCEVRCANCHRVKTAKENGWHMLDFLEEYEKKNADGGSHV